MIRDAFLHLMRKFSDDEGYIIGCLNEIEGNYNSSARHYHNLHHIESMLDELEGIKAQVQNFDTLQFSIFYHDVIYKPTRSDNELQSSVLFEKRISRTAFPHIDRCVEQIKATKEHKLSADPDTNILLDLDLAILGSAPDEYANYSRHIRKEYSIYPDFMYRKGRRKVLVAFLQSGAIFKTDHFRHIYEEQARKNLQWELSILS